MAAADAEHWSLTPADFNAVRQYLVGYPVDHEFWGGINAANLQSQMSFDILLGTTSGWYTGTACERARLMPAEARLALLADMMLAKDAADVLTQLARYLKVNRDDSEEEATWRIEAALSYRLQHRIIVQAVAKMAWAWAELSGTHCGMIIKVSPTVPTAH